MHLTLYFFCLTLSTVFVCYVKRVDTDMGMVVVMDSKKQTGFTLIELIIVIIILAILVAFAIPKYMTLDTKARTNVALGLQGALRSASAMVRVVAKTNGISAGSVTIDNTSGATISVAVNNTTGYPLATNAGVVAALESTAGFTITGVSPLVFQLNSAPSATATSCVVTYSDTVSPPNITATTTGC